MQTASDNLVVETGREPVACIIWAHGLGADKHDFESIIPLMGLPDSLPLRFVFPNAPVRPITVNGGMEMRGWYDIRSMTINEKEDAEGVKGSANTLAGLIEEQIRMGISSTRIVLAGFSQGGAIALYQGLQHPQQLAGIIVLSAYLPLHNTVDEIASVFASSTPVFMGHGSQDPIVPVELGLFTRDLLLERKMSVQWTVYPMGHSVSAEEISDLGSWLVELLRK
ncbi:MAG: alpha/beta hydrolase-fold protein [Pseudomonadota bacterium]|nr:alpha/beta hydrolase-fold protein [Pseudomonadota bacterium]